MSSYLIVFQGTELAQERDAIPQELQLIRLPLLLHRVNKATVISRIILSNVWELKIIG